VYPKKRYPGDWSLVEGFENPIRCSFSVGNACEVTQAELLLADPEVEKVVADKAYDSRVLIEMIHDHGAQAGNSTSR